MSRELALERFEAQRERLLAVGSAQRKLDQLEKLVYADMMEARKAAEISVVCPVDTCKAEAGLPCKELKGGAWLALPRTHGMREDLSGVHGEYSRDLMLSRVGSA